MISISVPGKPAGLIDGWEHLLRLEFHDIDTAETVYTPFDSSMARRTIDFCDSICNEVEHIHVHCDAGISRSAAVARFIADRYGLPFNHEYMLYNRMVFRILTDTAGYRILQDDEQNS